VSEWISLNGRLTPAAEASVSPLDRGFLYGDGVFETLRTYGGRPFRLTSHLDRLHSSARRLAIPWPEPRLSIDAEIGRTLEAARNAESAIRIMLTRGVGPIGYDPSGIAFPTLVVHVRPCPEPPPSARHEGVDVAIVSVMRTPAAALDPAIKSSNLLNNILAWQEAHRLRVYEPILLNTAGQIAEGASSNLFVVQEGRLFTPPEQAGILQGITRATVLDLARGDGAVVEERALEPDELRRADEAFLTSTLKGVLPIRRCDGWPIHDGRPGPITRRLMELYDAAAQAETKTGSSPGASFR